MVFFDFSKSKRARAETSQRMVVIEQIESKEQTLNSRGPKSREQGADTSQSGVKEQGARSIFFLLLALSSLLHGLYIYTTT